MTKATAVGFETLLKQVVLNDSTHSVDLAMCMFLKNHHAGRRSHCGFGTRRNAKRRHYPICRYQYKVNSDATAEDLIKKMLGITVAKDGTVSGQGEQVKKVTVDGKDFFGDDVSTASRNLPAELVDKIQLFDRLSDQAQHRQ